MNPFDWQQTLACGAYSRFPEALRRPVIGITGNFDDNRCTLASTYYKMVVEAGGTPVIIPPIDNQEVIINTLAHIDGLLLSGGGDYNPLYCGEQPSPYLGGICSERDLAELLTVRLAYNRQIPMLGICRGIQTLAMALGGHVIQDLCHQRDIPQTVKHSQQAPRETQTHTVDITPNSILHGLYKDDSIAVNSFHHQAVDNPGKLFIATARAKDGVIEAIESSDFKPVMGVQWHPECLASGAPLFKWLVDQAKAYHEACVLHSRILTLDTHCDTPMLFHQGVDIAVRDPRILVDLHKMDEGHQDATIMVSYLPQPKLGETFSSKVAFDVSSPFEYANLIFDKIEDMVAAHRDEVSIARTPSDLYEDKRKGRKSIMLGIENGIALNGDIANVKHFAQRGVVYITLCHNGDNDICDSAKGCNTHNGISRFGEKVVKEMNRWGIMVDLSHAGERSFYDAIDISATPIVCSHSSARSLCNHPRNLTDDQMRALASVGGVAQITLYPGFLRSEGEATVMDAIAHLEHAIHIMGIDHVGIGSDFDGDGGIRGLSCSSEMLSFTRMLLARRYNPADLQKIWGGNFLRVMSIVQQSANANTNSISIE